MKHYKDTLGGYPSVALRALGGRVSASAAKSEPMYRDSHRVPQRAVQGSTQSATRVQEVLQALAVLLLLPMVLAVLGG